MLTQEHLDKVEAFHGHVCPGMLIGFKAVEGAIAELGLSDDALPAVDEEIVAVVENDACGVDAVQVLLGCTYGKSNLITRIRGKMAFSFFSRDTGKSAHQTLFHKNPSFMWKLTDTYSHFAVLYHIRFREGFLKMFVNCRFTFVNGRTRVSVPG